MELDDLPRSGSPLELNVDLLKQFIEEDPRLTLRHLAEQLECFHTVVEKHLNELGATWRYGVWILHELSSHHLQYRVDACMDLTTSHCDYQRLRNLITGDKKWILYINYTHRCQRLCADEIGTATPKNDQHPRKVILSEFGGESMVLFTGKFLQVVAP